MREILDTLTSWRGRGESIALATVVGVDSSAPRDPGAAMAVNESGEVAGSVSGGCVESAVVEVAEKVLATGQPSLVEFGISDEHAFQVGLTCGGRIEVFVERVDW